MENKWSNTTKIYVVRDYDKESGYHYAKRKNLWCNQTGMFYHYQWEGRTEYYQTEFWCLTDARDYIKTHRNSVIYFIGTESDWFAGEDELQDIRKMISCLAK